MDYPLAVDNWLCRVLGHWSRSYADRRGVERSTCRLCGRTVPPFPKVPQ